ncbi:hypothetical protein EVAR_10602_1 [Eumeta japonica]|uniref:Uncharacterized protein n=1 Tax=Eumeta variegata TaxID=151549 RepID=A0A4C1U262_EUMVA|nr:hypothetical protein EVAR_10602_1 [Eumeta japonica]
MMAVMKKYMERGHVPRSRTVSASVSDSRSRSAGRWRDRWRERPWRTWRARPAAACTTLARHIMHIVSAARIVRAGAVTAASRGRARRGTAAADVRPRLPPHDDSRADSFSTDFRYEIGYDCD